MRLRVSGLATFLMLTVFARGQALHSEAKFDTPVAIDHAIACDNGSRIFGIGKEEAIYAWTAGKSEPRKISLAEGRPEALACAGRTVAAGFGNGKIVIVDGDKGEVKLRLDAKSSMWGLTLSPEATFVAVATTGSPTQVFDTRTGQRVSVGRTSFGGSTSATFSPKGDLLLSTDDDTNVRAYGRNGKLLYSAEAGPLEPFAAAFTGDGQRFVVATADGAMSSYESTSGKRLRATHSTGNPIFAIQMFPDSQHVAAFELDPFTLKPIAVGVWDMQSDHWQKLDVDPETVIGCGADGTHLLLVRRTGTNTLTLDSVR